MGRKDMLVKINAKLLEFAIGDAGYDTESFIEELRKKYKKRSNFLKTSFETDQIKFSELKIIDGILNRGLPFYLLSKPPTDKTLLKFRKQLNSPISSKLAETVRKYSFFREMMNDLMDNLNEPHTSTTRQFSISKNALDVATEIRNTLGYFPKKFKNPEKVFKYLRQTIEENLGIFVFRERINHPSIFGFMLKGEGLPTIIVINKSESKHNELFTLIHELGHCLINNDSTIDDFVKLNSSEKEETWCNRFAFSFFLSEKEEMDEKLREKSDKDLLNPEYYAYLSKKYHVSKLAMMIRLVQLNLISSKNLSDFKEKFIYPVDEQKKKSESKSKDFKLNPVFLVLSQYSNGFLRLIRDNYSSGYLTRHEVARRLSIRKRERFEELMGRIK